jgi:Cu(I)/Ag(I) efflux system membrane fusion protein
MNTRITVLIISLALLAGCGQKMPATDIAKQEARKILYYRNPMGLPDTSPVPKQDSMGMEYLPVYADEQQAAANEVSGTVNFSIEKMQKLGVKTEVVARRKLSTPIHAAGIVEADERGQYNIAPKFEGWIEKLYVNTTGQQVAAGQALAEIYSPDLIAAQREYLIAQSLEARAETMQGSDKALTEAALQRLRNWGISDAQLNQLAQNGERRTLAITAPASGTVIEKPSVAGMRFMPGEVLFKIANLNRVWLNAEVFEQDLGKIKLGAAARINIATYPDKTFSGKVDFIYPTLNPETRTGKIRIELANPNGLLKPAMFANVELIPSAQQAVLAVPDSAIIDSGTRQIVLLAKGGGKFEPRTVTLGVRGDGYVEVLSGVAAGDQVVVSANFLIDAESNLKAALGGFAPVRDTGAIEGDSQEIKPVTPSHNQHEGH